MKSVTFNQTKKLRLLAISIGIIYIIFGSLKFFPNFSPAESIAIETIDRITFGLISAELGIKLLALLEVFIGIFLVAGKFLRTIIIITFCHLICTFSPLFLMPEYAFQSTLLSPSLLGQYILKNVILICALIAIYPTKSSISN